MFRRKVTLIICVFLVAVLTACNLPGGTATESVEPDLALTITALANITSSTPSAPQETATPEFTATAGPTSTPSVPEVTVSQNTNCRTGPGLQYENIGALLITQKATVVGKNTSTGYWIINNPGKTGTCWLYPQYATVSGNTANLQEYSIPPTPTPSPTPTFTPTSTPSAPAAVENVNMSLTTCGGAAPYQHGGTLTWEDKSSNEDGFNIYVNNVLIASIPANSTSYIVAPSGSFAAGIASKFEVEAFNGAGKAAKKSDSKGCP